MEIRVLRYFLTAAQEENITRAAEKLHLTQPTLSRQLSGLEEELGQVLFLRGKRKITLTIEMKPDENRQYIKISASAKSALAPVLPVGTTLGIAANPDTGEMLLVESTPQVPGQVAIDGSVQEGPKLLKVAAMK